MRLTGKKIIALVDEEFEDLGSGTRSIAFVRKVRKSISPVRRKAKNT